MADYTYMNVILQYQEEERRIALVMARKEEEKKKEMNKMSVMKVRNRSSVFYLKCIFVDLPCLGFIFTLDLILYIIEQDNFHKVI